MTCRTTLFAALAVLALAPAVASATEKPAAAGMQAAAAAKTGQGVGQVKAVDAKGGKVTLHHGPIPALGWPAMTMPFNVAPGLLANIKVGQTVKFTVADGDMPTITAIAPQ